MTVYVDSARIPATVGRIKARWSHLTADTPEELHEFAESIGMRRSWFQTCKQRCGRDGEPCVHWHYDVTDAKRAEAIAAGAVEIDMYRMGEILIERRAAQRATIAACPSSFRGHRCQLSMPHAPGWEDHHASGYEAIWTDHLADESSK